MVKEIQSGPFSYQGVVSAAGYEWLRGVDGKPRLIPRFVPGVENRRYRLEQGVFLAFARLGSTKDDIKAFADKYGDIRSRHDLKDVVARTDGTGGEGTLLNAWREEVAYMRVVAAVWENIRHRRTDELAKLIKWTETEVSYSLKTPHGWHFATLGHAEIPHMPLSRFNASKRDVLAPARYALHREINLRLSEAPATPQMTWTSDGHQRITCTPPNLLSALWLQFAQAVVGDFDLYSCDSCGNFFHRGPGGRRADTTTCSDRCRQKKSRKRKAE